MLWPALESSCAGLHDTEGNLDWPGEWPHDTAAALQVFQDSIDAHLGERLVSLEDELMGQRDGHMSARQEVHRVHDQSRRRRGVSDLLAFAATV